MAGRSEGMDMSRGGMILSGGQGSRMGYADKNSLIHGEKTFLDITGNKLHSPDVPCHLSQATYKSGEPMQGFTVIEDTVRRKDGEWIGPMGGTWSCLEQITGSFLFFASCDIPLLRGRMAECLLKYWEPGMGAVLWCTRDDRLQPMCVLYPRTYLRELKTRIHSRSYRIIGFLEHVNCVEAKTAKEYIPDTWLLNANTPRIYKKLGEKRFPVLAVSGRKDTGKTQLLEKLVGIPSGAGVHTAAIKHDGHEFEADVPDTNGFRMKKAGAYETVVYPGNQLPPVKDQSGMEAEDFFALFPEVDLILLEGQKYSSLPKVEVLRAAVSSEPVCDPWAVLAYVSDVPFRWGEVFLSDSIDEISEVVIRQTNGKC